MKPTKNNFIKLCTCMYEFTGFEYYINLPFNISYEIHNGANYFVIFYTVLKDLRQLVKNGNTCRFSLIRNGLKVPCTINHIDIF